MTTVTAPEPQSVSVAPLGPTATCEGTASGSEVASVRTANEQGQTLDFCAHHFAEHEAALYLQGFTLREDKREVLTQNYKGQAGE